MRWLAVALLALVAVPAQAQKADDAAIRGIVRGIYSGYQTRDVAPRIKKPRATTRFAAVEKQCADMGRLLDRKEPDSSYGFCANDYDVYCQCQDWEGIDFPNMKVEVAIIGASADATLSFSGNKGPDLRLAFRRDARGWALDDIWEYRQPDEGETADEGLPPVASYRLRLMENINEMRATLKMAAWAEPKG